MKYHQVTDGEDIIITTKNHRVACCDCGLKCTLLLDIIEIRPEDVGLEESETTEEKQHDEGN